MRTRERSSTTPALGAGLVLLLALPAAAADGVIEINQTCAEQTGCMPNDAPGFPVDIDWRGSYRLTSPLLSPVPNQPVIRVLATYVTIDLNGFGVHQPGVYDQAGGGIVGGGHVTVKNGFVTDTTNDGIRLANDARVLDVEASGNDRDGVNVQGQSIVRGVVATFNKHNGISAGVASSVDGCTATTNDDTGISLASGTLTRSTATQNYNLGASLGAKTSFGSNYFEANQGGDVSGGHASAGNFCGDGSCTSDGRKRFYVTPTPSYVGDQAAVACAPGFHLAALSELVDASSLHYDFKRGLQTEAGDGRGAPFGAEGWVRSASTSYSTGPTANLANCVGYTSASAGATGTIAELPLTFGASPVTVATAWSAEVRACNIPHLVWCVED